MNTPEPMYNMHFLGNIAALNVEEGLRQSGSRRAYFNELSSFEDGVQQILDRLLVKRPKKELLADLSELLQRLISICDTNVSTQVEKVLILVKRNGDQNIIIENLYQIQKKALLLIEMIREADIVLPDALKETDSSEVGPSTQTVVRSAADRPKVTPRPAFFTTLIKHIEESDYDAALDELKAISSLSYGDEIDNALERVSKYIVNFDYEQTAGEMKKFMSLVLGANQPDKKPEKKKILAIDDMPDILNTLKSLLKNDYTVYCVPNHLAALKFLASNTPDLIIIDIEMPEMDGFTLVKIIRQMNSCKQTPVVFLTGNVSVENVMTSIESGGNDFIKKPIDYKILISKIQKHLRKNSIDV